MKEKELYPSIEEKFEELFKTKVNKVYLEIMSNKKLSNALKEKIPNHRHLIFYFLKESFSRYCGFVENKHSSDFIVIEV